jgi:hypothetical protein
MDDIARPNVLRIAVGGARIYIQHSEVTALEGHSDIPYVRNEHVDTYEIFRGFRSGLSV